MSRASSSSATADLIDHALALLAAAQIERPPKAMSIRGELAQWRELSPVHGSAYEEALRRWNALGNALPELRFLFDEPEAQRPKIGARGLLCIAVLIAGFALVIRQSLEQPAFEQTFRTQTAQIAKFSLPDGSRINLNAQSELQAALYRDRRVIELNYGEARFEVAPDTSKPFQVRTRAGTVEVVGTVFTVSDRGKHVAIEVEEGRVRFLPRGDNSALELDGTRRLLARENIPPKVETYDARGNTQWRHGWLVFDNEPLADALLAINPYRNTPLRLADNKAGRLRLTGRFRAGDSQSLLSALPKILPIEINEQSDGSIEIRQR